MNECMARIARVAMPRKTPENGACGHRQTFATDTVRIGVCNARRDNGRRKGKDVEEGKTMKTARGEEP